MEPEHLANQWYEERQERGLSVDSYQPLRRALVDFLPADALAGIAFREDHPIVIALTGGAFVLFEAPEPDQSLDARAFSVSAFGSLSVKCSLEGGIRVHLRLCAWTLEGTDLDALTLATRRPVGSHFATDNGGERVMLTLAERMGWNAPLHREGTDDGDEQG